MTNINTTFTVCGITTDSKGNSKVRWTQDLIRRTKLFIKQGHTRVDLVDLPQPMTKLEALTYIANLEQFSNAADRATISDAIAYREVVKAKVTGIYAPRKRGRPRKNPDITTVMKTTSRSAVKNVMSIEHIRARASVIDSEVAAVLDVAGIKV